MTRYEIGFMNKCAEYGVDGETVLTKLSQSLPADAITGGIHSSPQQDWRKVLKDRNEIVTGGIHSSPHRDWRKVLKDRNEIVTGGIHSPPQQDWGLAMKDMYERVTGGIHSSQPKLPWPMQPPTTKPPSKLPWPMQPSYPTRPGLPKSDSNEWASKLKELYTLMGDSRR